MRLDAAAALAVCRKSIEFNNIVLREEGGLWHSPGFEEIIESIWDSKLKSYYIFNICTYNRLLP